MLNSHTKVQIVQISYAVTLSSLGLAYGFLCMTLPQCGVLVLSKSLFAAADVLQLAALLCPPSTVSLASFGALLAHLPLTSLQPPPPPPPPPSPSPSATPCPLDAAKGTITCYLALCLQSAHAALCLEGKVADAFGFIQVLLIDTMRLDTLAMLSQALTSWCGLSFGSVVIHYDSVQTTNAFAAADVAHDNG